MAGAVVLACAGDDSPGSTQETQRELACIVLAGSELSVDGAPYSSPMEYCSVHPWKRGDPDSPYDLWLGNEDGYWYVIVSIVPGKTPDAQGKVTLDVVAAPELGGDGSGPPGSASLLFKADGQKWSTSDGDGSIGLRSYQQAASGATKFVTLPDGSQLVFSEITFGPALNVVSPAGGSKTVSGTLKVAVNLIATSTNCPDVVPGGAECVEFNACSSTQKCTCENTQCALSGKCCIIGGAPCGADDECCSRYCSPHKRCEPRPAVDPCAQGGTGGSGGSSGCTPDPCVPNGAVGFNHANVPAGDAWEAHCCSMGCFSPDKCCACVGHACKSDAECCEGACNNGVCCGSIVVGDPVVCCRPSGASCIDDANCCSGKCNGYDCKKPGTCG